MWWTEGGPEGTFPFGKERPFLREHEWVILKLLCLPVSALAKMDPASLARASGGKISEPRADELIRTVRLAALPGLGSWAARLLAEAGLDVDQALHWPPEQIAERLQAHFGYPLWDAGAMKHYAELQFQWRCKKEAA